MTISEFKAFLEGMDIKDCPTEEQWGRIREKIDALEAFRVDPAPCYPSPYVPNWPQFTWEPASSIPNAVPLPYSTCTTEQ